MSTPTRFRVAGDRAAARLRKRAEWAFTAAQRRAAHDLAYEHWITGALAPYRITRALDAAELYGPEVDVACGVQEPAVDEWEAGTRYPSFEQLLALAALTHQSPDSFIAREGDENFDLRDTTMWCHISKAGPPLTEFTAAAVEECPGTNDYRDTHLF
ncbi:MULTISPECIES: helix-turn-helix domain-containing protein [Rhodococcus]|uniref:hypothetical protein n=1 Tax=Rhodococcus TaxID=1827 RepID=UPI0012E35120|nr:MULTISPECIES: hypothetical protein [Rhodococcus]MEA1798290.1 hypothetical protein [Rhodococcus qingshengii]